VAVVEVARARWPVADRRGALRAVRRHGAGQDIGLHWLLGFVPLVLLWLALRLPQTTLAKLGRFFIGFAALHVAIVVAIAALPMETWKNNKLYDGIVLTFEADALVERLRPSPTTPGQRRLFQRGDAFFPFAQALMVFGEGGYHARQDDFLTDWREHDGRNILILTKRRPASAEFFAWFHEVELKTVELRGVTFTVILGRGFNYAAYRGDVLARVKSRYYALPAWLPQKGCSFCDRYFPDIACTH